MSLILAALGWLTETFVASLVQKASEVAIQWSSGVEDGGGQTLNKLKNSLLKIQPIVSKVENMWIEDEILKRSVNELLLQLKDAAYDAEDLLDELQYRALQQQIEQQGDEPSNLSSCSSGIPPRKKRKTTWSNAARSLFGKQDDKDDDVIKVMEETRERLDSIAADINERIAWIVANGRGKELKVSSVSRRTGSLVETRLFGRETELQELGGLLSKLGGGSNNSSISVLTVVGIGGVGKTTLVQEAYNNLVGVCFDFKFWVCVSEDFSVERLTREMIESTTGEKCDLMNFDKLQLSIKDKIASKRFLLVLDDMWDLDSQKWERFCAPLRFGAPGSKILITTRFRNIADIVGSTNPINLYGLDEKSFWQYFEKCAFISQKFEDYPELEAIAKKNIYKLKGLPLAARTLGGLLNQSIDKRHWETVFESEIWKLQQKETDVLPVLQLSYQYLPTHLKRCFVFCSLFPKDFIFQERYLIQIWMAEGFVAARKDERMEDIGSSYFRQLVDRSFFQQLQYEGQYVIHDLLHDLAELISEGECYRIEGTKPHEIRSMIRHMSVFQTRLQELNSCNKLRTVLISNFFYKPISLPVHTFFERLKNINVLVLQSCLQELPETIGNLVHLRYLDISSNPSLMKLPESLCNLCNLQTLILTDLPLHRLPYGMSKLINLRHLVAGEEVISAISEIGKLTSLQELSAFKVLKKQGHEIEELHHLTQLQGMLQIKSLENIVSEDEARKGELNNKKYLEALQLEWAPPSDTNFEKQQLIVSEEVLEALQPHQALKNLTIKGYKGAQSPSWLKEEVLSHLENLALVKCKRWKDLSYIVQLPNLKSLCIEGNSVIKQISRQTSVPMGSKFFLMLEELYLEDLLVLEKIPNLWQLPSLRILHIKRIPLLKYIGHSSYDSIERKSILNLKELVLEDLVALEELPNLGQLPCLEVIELIALSSLKYLGHLLCDLRERDNFPMLQELELRDLLALEEIPNLGQLPCLEHLSIHGIPKLKIVEHGFLGIDKAKYFPCLKSLSLHNMPSWEEWSWPKDQALFPCLGSFTMWDCPKIKRLPPLPCSLVKLFLWRVGLTGLPRLCKGIESNSSDITPCLSDLDIHWCPNLRSLEEGLLMHHLPNIKSINISHCKELMRLPVRSFQELTSLKTLAIATCPKLMTQDEKFDLLPPSIEDLKFHGSGDLNKFQPSCQHVLISSLTRLSICDYPHLVSLPRVFFDLKKLEILRIINCGELKSIKGLGDLESLERLTIKRCPKLLPDGGNKHGESLLSLISLWIDDTALLRVPSIRKRLSSILELKISSSSQEVVFEGEDQELLRSLAALESLRFRGCANLKLLPTKLHTLSSLRCLEIASSPLVESLPETGLPTSLIDLIVWGNCHPTLQKQSREY